MSFKGFSKDGEPLYDTKEAAIERAKQLVAWSDEPDTKIMVHRKHVPLWFARLVEFTPFDFLAFSELK